jgi:hypothetical protein
MSQTDKAVTIEMRAAGNTGRKGYCRDLKARMRACQSNEALLLAPSATIVRRGDAAAHAGSPMREPCAAPDEA